AIKNIEIGEMFNIEDLRNEKTALFISYDVNKVELYKFFLSPLFSQLFEKTFNYFDEEDPDNFYSVAFLIDEFANIGKIPSFANTLTTIRSRRMAIEVFVQSAKQIEELYGKVQSDIIIENC